MASTKATVFVSGKISWAKILGEPVPNFNKDGREWTFEVELDEAGLQKIIQNGLTDRIKGRGYNIGTKAQHKEREPFIQLKRTEFTKDGNPNTPIRIYDSEGEAWDNDSKIGNGSTGDVKLDIRDYGVGKKKGMYPVALRINNLVEYESSEFSTMDNGQPDFDAPAKGKARAKAKAPVVDNFQNDLDDEAPF